jgi:sulfur-oxidizing protein SoxA
MKGAAMLALAMLGSACGLGPPRALPAAPPAADPAAAMRRSGFEYMSPQTQAMQADDTQNPGMLWVGEGEALWGQREGTAQRACAGCHGGVAAAPAPAAASAASDLAAPMRGVAARYPAFDAASGGPVNLQQRINLCRQRHQQAPAWRPESRELLALEAYVAHQSRGLPIAPPADPRLQPHRLRGQALYAQRIGQLDLACAQCHDQRAGQRLAGSVIPPALPTGYPLYRLEWQGLGSLQRRLRNCMTGVRAQTPAHGDIELVELELYLAVRAAGMAIESPAVRP